VINFSENQIFSVIPHLMRNPDFILKWGFNLLSGFLLPRYLIRGYRWIPASQAVAETVSCHPEFISGSNEMLKRVQHDIFTDFAHSATTCFAGMTKGTGITMITKALCSIIVIPCGFVTELFCITDA